MNYIERVVAFAAEFYPERRKECMEAMNHDDPELSEEWCEKYRKHLSFLSKDKIKKSANEAQWRLIYRHIPHGSNHKVLGVVTDFKDKRFKRMIVAFNFKGEIYRTAIKMRLTRQAENNLMKM